MRLLLTAAAVSLILAGCKKEPVKEELVPTKATIGATRMIEYFPPKQSFNCLAPAKWEVEERESLGEETVAFRADGSNILIVKNPNSSYKTAEEYANSFWEIDPRGKNPPVEKESIDGRTVFLLSRTQPIKKLHSTQTLYEARERHAFIPAASGYYQIRLSATPESYAAMLPIFDAVVRSFKPKS